MGLGVLDWFLFSKVNTLGKLIELVYIIYRKALQKNVQMRKFK